MRKSFICFPPLCFHLWPVCMQKEETFQFLWFILESFPKKACLNKQKKDLELFLSQAVQVQLQLSETAAVRTIPGNKSAQKLL